MMRAFHQNVAGLGLTADRDSTSHGDMVTMQTIDKIYAKTRTIDNAKVVQNDQPGLGADQTAPDCRFHWPIIDDDIRDATQKQLEKSISIYGNGGIFGEFEQAWKDYHEQDESFALLHNSGTNALQALYFAAQFQPGDEVCSTTYI
jgi:hypothetical protein